MQIRDTSVTSSKVTFSQQYLNVYITDYHGEQNEQLATLQKLLITTHFFLHLGLVFISEPSNVTTGMGRDIHFNCDYFGTHASPFWKITHPTGTLRTVSTARLPRNHFSTRMGLAIKDVDETHNMTSYACLFQIHDRDQIVIISSREGTLTVLDTIAFEFQLSNNSDFELSASNRTLELFHGDSIPPVTIKKFGYSTDTFIVYVRIKSLNNGHCSTCKKTISDCMQ